MNVEENNEKISNLILPKGTQIVTSIKVKVLNETYLLCIFQVLLTGIYLMQTGEIEANLVNLNEVFKLSYIPELIKRKVSGTEKGILPNADLQVYHHEYDRLTAMLQKVFEQSNLPEKPSAKDDLNDLLIRLRLKELATK